MNAQQQTFETLEFFPQLLYQKIGEWFMAGWSSFNDWQIMIVKIRSMQITVK